MTDPTTVVDSGRSGRGERLIPWLGGALLLVLLATWSLGTARYGGPDEPAHVLRAYAVAHGQVQGEVPDSASIELAPGYRIVDVPASLASGDPACFRHDSAVTPDCAVPSTSTATVPAATSAGVNPPLYYALVGSLARLGDESQPLTYRYAAAALVAAVLALAAWRLAPLAHRRPWAATVGLGAITPAAWFLFGVVNPNSLEIALAALAWVGVARWWCSPDERTPSAAWWIGVPMAAAVAIRPVALSTAATVVAIVYLAARPRKRAATAMWLPIMAAIGTLALWQVVLGMAVVDDPRTAEHGSVAHAFGEAIAGLPRSAAELVGSLGWLEYWAPLVAQLAWGVAVVAVGRAGRHDVLGARTLTSDLADRPARRRLQAAAVVWLVALVATPVVFEVVFFGSIGPIWQGRYSISLWLGGAALVISAAPDPAGTGPAALRSVALGRIGTAAAIGCLALAEVATFWAVVRRATVGTDGSWWFTDAVDIGAPAHPRLLLIVHATIAAVLALGVAHRFARRSPYSK
jgi:hypothetical protein